MILCSYVHVFGCSDVSAGSLVYKHVYPNVCMFVLLDVVVCTYVYPFSMSHFDAWICIRSHRPTHDYVD